MERQATCKEGTHFIQLQNCRLCIDWYISWIGADCIVYLPKIKIECNSFTSERIERWL